jgi:hypothetical protein
MVTTNENDIRRAALLCAIAGAVTGKQLEEAKALLPDMYSSGPLNFTVQITGGVGKGRGTPPSSGTNPATIDLFNRSHLIEAMLVMGVTDKKLRAALKKVTAKDGHAVDYSAKPANAGLLTVINEVGREIAAGLPQVQWSSNGRRGDVRPEVDFKIVE